VTTDKPALKGAKEDAGGNGQGIVLSADGKRLTYLSIVGYPRYSANMPAFDPTNFDARPVSYALGVIGVGARQIVYHPRLPLVAAPTPDGAIFFQRESGEVQPDRLEFRLPRLGAVKVQRVFFAPDGQHLILECAQTGQHYLRLGKLKLSSEELAAMATTDSSSAQGKARN
jgi:hypothetical protein